MEIIIVGGGFCGSTLALYLDKHTTINTTLIDNKQYFEYTPALPKLLSQNIILKEIQPKYSDFLSHVKHIAETVVTITPNTVHTNKNHYSYDYLVICPGIQYPIPFINAANIYSIKNGETAQILSEKIQKMKSIIIIGGGTVGVEAAAEIITHYPDKKLTIIHPKDRLINRNIPFASRYAHNFLTKKGVSIIYNEKVKTINNNIYSLTNGQEIKADLGIWCGGNKTDSTFMKEFPKTIFSERNALIVNDNLTLKGFNNIFIGGDISAIPEEKTAFNADRQAKKIYKNLLRKNQNLPLKSYRSIPSFLIISLGKKNGILTYKNIIIPGRIAALSKWIVRRILLISRH